jgi:uncharacterized linocin/CFP29 family protein
MANNNLNREKIWNDQAWKSIDDGVKTSVGAIRVAQKVFPTAQLSNTTSVPADIFDPVQFSIAEGQTKPYLEIAVEFPLTHGQVEDDTGRTGLTLSKLASKSLALAEDLLFFQGQNAQLPPSVTIESGKDSVAKGILGLIGADRTIVVNPPDPGAPTNSGAEILAAVAKGISLLTGDLQAPPFALILDTNAYAETWGSVINGAPAFTVLTPVLTGGIYGTPGMPSNTGIIAALGGEPTTIYFDQDPMTEHTQKDRDGKYFFRIFERVQFVARDSRAFVKLTFPSISGSTQNVTRQ